MKIFHQKSFQELKKDIQENLYRCCEYSGIGGSDLKYGSRGFTVLHESFKVHFVSNVDGDHVNEVIKN
jgi:glucose-6-phosphate isomerase